MSSLAVVFNYILGYLYAFVALIFGGGIALPESSDVPFIQVAIDFTTKLLEFYPDGDLSIPVYLVIIPTAIFVLGAVFGLVKRMTK